jgi:hypothetical protein
MTEKIKLNIVLFGNLILFCLLLLLPNNVLANNCCEISTTIIGANGSVSDPIYSCKDDAGVTKETCVSSNSGAGLSTKNENAVFVENSYCKENKCVSGELMSGTKVIEKKFEPINFRFNISLPGFPSTILVDSTLLPSYISWIYKFIVGIAGLLAVFMITIGGLMWIFAGGNGSKIGKAREYIFGAIIGLLLAIFSYSILYIINPQLTANKFPAIMNVQKASIVPMSDSDYERLTGGKKMVPAEMKKMAKEMAKKYKADYCAILTILQTESGGDPSAIGFDEDVKNATIGSRNKFVANGCKQTHSGEVKGACGVYGSAINDDRCMLYYSSAYCPKGESYYKDKFKNCKKEDLCLDWRYTRGIGLFQASVWSDCDVFGQKTRCVDAGSKQFTPKQFLKVENQMAWFAAKWSSWYCQPGFEIKKCWIRYAGGYNEFVEKKVAVYNECKKSN